MLYSRGPSAVGIDLGTAWTRVIGRAGGLVFDQPSICCFQAYDAVPRFIAAGTEASGYLGRVSKPFKVVHPLRNGVLSDMIAARELLHFIRRAVGADRRFPRVRPSIGIPADATQSERRALATAAVDAGFAEPLLIPEPLLAAIGLGMPVHEARGRMVVDCGAGTTEAVVISMGEICVSKSARGGGEALAHLLVDHLHLRHRFLVGASASERLKIQLAEAITSGVSEQLLHVQGLDSALGLPRTLTLPASELVPVWLRHVEQIVDVVHSALRETPPELSTDIFEDGIVLTGGGALNPILVERIGEKTGVIARVAEAPMNQVALGLQRVLQGVN